MNIKCADLNLAATIESGQVFGFAKEGKAYKGILDGRSVELVQSDGNLNVQGRVSERFVREYFDLDRDLSGVYALLKEDPALKLALERFQGLRLIKQDAWEALACFIISSNNNVKRIMGIHRNLAAHFEKRRGDGLQRFPAAREIAASSEKVLRELGLGYRAPFLWATATFVSNNTHYLEAVREADYDGAVERVLCFPGIGPKVADCVLLYGFQRLEAFPVDVWIERAVRKLYFKGRRQSSERIRRFGMKRWGADAGYVQQYLFHGARHGVFGF
jgi:N-glycosylase/DNA lyase